MNLFLPSTARVCAGRCLVLIFLSAAGCGKADSSGQWTEVTGTVTSDGKPLAGAEVQFVPKSDAALGVHSTTTDEQGAFTLKSDKSNAPLRPGAYAVLVRKVGSKGNDPSLPGGGMGAVKNELPAVYSDKAKTPFQADLQAGTQALPPFEIKPAKPK